MNLIGNLEKIQTKNILVIGDIMLDRYSFGITKRISQEAPVPVILKKDEKIVLGGAANVAVNLKKAHQNVSILSVIGNDLQGEKLLDCLKKQDIDTSLIVKDDSRCTTTKTRIVGQNNAQMLRIDEEDSSPIQEKVKQILIEELEKNIKKFDLVVISDYKKGLLDITNTQKMIEICNKANRKTLVDIKEPNYQKYANAYLIKPNLNELKDITGMNVDSDEDIVKAAKALLENTKSQYVLATRGKDGMTIVGKQDFKHIACKSREVFDVTGAGDTVISYLATGLVSDINLMEAIQIANYAAGVEVSKFGTYAVTIDDIKQYIEKENNVFFENKIVTINKLKEILKEKSNKKIVFTNGCFDIFHVGHSRYLREASKLGDILIVGVNSDASVKRLKGKERPIMNEKERMELLASLEFVSYVVMFEEDTPIHLIKEIRPDIITKGGDYKPEEIVGSDIVESYGGQVIVCPYIESKSTTSIINKIKNS